MFDSKEPYVSNAQSKAALPSIVAFLVACIFSMHYLIAKKILMSVPPESLAAARGLLGGITLTVVYRVNFLKLLKGPHAEYLLLVTIFGFGLNQWLLFAGLARTSGPDAALVSGAIPMVATVLGIKYGGEAIVSKKIAGAFLGLICVSSYLLYQYDIHLTTHVAGNLLVFGNVLCFCLAMLIIKTKLHGLKAVEITSVMLVLGGSIMALAGTDFTPIWRYCLSSKSGFFQILFEVFMTTALGYALNLWTLQKLSLANATVFNYLQLPLTACFGAMMFNGPVSWALAAALVGTGLSCLLVVTAKG